MIVFVRLLLGPRILVTGRAASGYPTKNAYQSSFGGGTDMIVTQIDPGASGAASLQYSTYLGGTTSERGYAIAVDSAGTAYVTGSSYNSGFPIQNAYDSTHNGGADVLVVKINPAASGSASLLYSTYLGGSSNEEGLGIAADNAGTAYVTGYASSGFPLVNAAQATYGGTKDVFVAKLNTLVSGSSGLVYSTYLGGSAEDRGTAIIQDGANHVSVTGWTRSDAYPTKNPTQAARGGDSCSSTPCKDAIVSQLDLGAIPANQLTFSTYLGGLSDEEGRGIARDGADRLAIVGVTSSTPIGGTGKSDALVAQIALNAEASGPAPYDEAYAYDQIGNLLAKAGVGYQYGANGNGTGAGPHQARTVGGAVYQYDANGNLFTGGGRTLTWDTENRVASATANGVTETYTYDADGERVTKTSGGVTTIYMEGLWEQVVGGATTIYYTFNDMVLAQRDSVTNDVSYLFGDHLGSVSAVATATAAGGPLVSRQQFMPWGTVRTGGITETPLNYTGQRLDGSGLLYYHARYYDPTLARFVSADSVVPGSASGSLDGVALKPLTVDFHEPGFAATLAGENRQPFWFQMSRDQRQQADYQWGPVNPQALNRYSYVDNNPVNDTDATGHCGGDGIGSVICGGGGGGTGGAGGGKPATTGGNTSMAQAVVDIVVIVVGTVLLADGTQQTTHLASSTPDSSPRPDEKHPTSELPVAGDHPYVPPRQKGNPTSVKNPRGSGYVDKKGNIWVWAKDQHAGPHWDVQHPNGRHTNVYPDGKVHQGKDNF